MTPAQIPADEPARLAGLRRLGLLDTPPEARFDRLVELASLMLGTPIALISLIDSDRQWFKAKVGLVATETDRELAFCAHAIVGADEEFVVPDALLDARFADNPQVTGDPHVRFYAGHVLRDHTGLAMGTLCVIDREPRDFGSAELQILARLAELVEQEFEREHQHLLISDLSRTERETSLILDTLTEGLVLRDSGGSIHRWNPAAERLLGLTWDQLAGRTGPERGWWLVRADGTRWDNAATLPTAIVLATGEPVIGLQMGVHRPDGTVNWLRVSSHPVRDRELPGISTTVTSLTDITAEVLAQTERLRLEDELRRSEELARISLDSLEQGVVVTDSSRRVLRMNPAAEQILGESADDLSRRNVRHGWILTDDRGEAISFEDSPVQRAITRGEPVVGETLGWTRADGRRITIRLSCTPNVDGVGSALVTFTDITDEFRAQRLLDATLETAPVGLAILDHDRRIVRCNATFAEQAGRDQAELIGMDTVALVAADDQSDAAAAGRELLDGTRLSGEMELHVIRPDGTEVWVETRLAVIPHRDQPLAIAATFDVTERRRMTRELSRFSYLFEHSNDIIVVIDAHGEVLYSSPSGQRLLGYPEGLFPAGGIFGIIHPDDAAATAVELRALLDHSTGTAPFTVRVAAYDGEWRCLECVGVNLLDEAAVRGVVITARDATERIRLTEQLAHRASHDTLTDLPNRATLDEFLAGALARAQRNDTLVGVCFVDLDGFKAVNDTMGHAAGDQLLVDVANEINRCLRRGDTAARVGGDEFVLVLDAVTSPRQALIIATRVRDAIGSLAVGDGARSEFGASVGLALSRRGDTVSEVLRRADAALYRAKIRHNSSIEVEGLSVTRTP